MALPPEMVQLLASREQHSENEDITDFMNSSTQASLNHSSLSLEKALFPSQDSLPQMTIAALKELTLLKKIIGEAGRSYEPMSFNSSLAVYIEDIDKLYREPFSLTEADISILPHFHYDKELPQTLLSHIPEDSSFQQLGPLQLASEKARQHAYTDLERIIEEGMIISDAVNPERWTFAQSEHGEGRLFLMNWRSLQAIDTSTDQIEDFKTTMREILEPAGESGR